MIKLIDQGYAAKALVSVRLRPILHDASKPAEISDLEDIQQSIP